VKRARLLPARATGCNAAAARQSPLTLNPRPRAPLHVAAPPPATSVAARCKPKRLDDGARACPCARHTLMPPHRAKPARLPACLPAPLSDCQPTRPRAPLRLAHPHPPVARPPNPLPNTPLPTAPNPLPTAPNRPQPPHRQNYRIVLGAKVPVYNPNFFRARVSGNLSVSFYDAAAGWKARFWGARGARVRGRGAAARAPRLSEAHGAHACTR
jgi:hypothetical protein